MVILSAKHEEYAQLIAGGMPKYRAYALAYGRKETDPAVRANGSRLWSHLKASPKIRARVSELKKQRRKSIDLTADQLLDDLLLNIDLATAAGQHSAAISGIKVLGGELYSMFTERKETMNINVDLGNIRTSAQLQKYLEDEYGPQLTQQLLDHWHKPKAIEYDPTEAHSDALRADSETLDAELEANNQGLGEANNRAVEAENRAVVFDRDRARPDHSDLDAKTAQLALQSLANSKPPKV
jgi:hypothetical protein